MTLEKIRLFIVNILVLNNCIIWKYSTKIKWLSLFDKRMLPSWMTRNWWLETFLSSTNKKFDITVITETRITKNVSPRSNLSMDNFFLSLLLKNHKYLVPFFTLLIIYLRNLVLTQTLRKVMNWTLPLLRLWLSKGQISLLTPFAKPCNGLYWS